METKKISLSQLAPLIVEELEADGSFEISIKGTSMLPLLVQGRDTVVLKKADGPLKKYDLPLYRRDDGTYVLHRVVAVKDGKYNMCGDNQWVIEKGIEPSQVIGKVCTVNRKGKEIRTDSFGYRLYCRVWQLLFPVRKYLVKIRGKLSK
ncbi:MAG: S24/S26 family peptidase [Clostridia bacterium]|nr:S24/S26 family peptidase [Clostridia bacterium]